jgi:hypothetical protein
MPILSRPGICTLLAFTALACSGPRPIPADPSQSKQELILVIQDSASGATEVSWRPASEFDWARLDHARTQAGPSGPVVLASRRARDCDQEHLDCFRQCWKRKPPSPIERGGASHYSHCQNTCREDYEDCLKLNATRALEFKGMNDAIDWLKRNRRELLVGTVVIAAGVTFVVVSAGAGILVLAPVVLLTQYGSAREGAVCEG